MTNFEVNQTQSNINHFEDLNMCKVLNMQKIQNHYRIEMYE